MEDGVFQGQLQFWNLFLLGLRKSDMTRKYVLFINLEVDLLVVKWVQVEHLIVLGLLLGYVEGVHQIRVDMRYLLQNLNGQVVVGD